MKILIKIFSVGALFFNVLSAAENAAKTEKIKIISACCLNGKWTFNIYDGLSDKRMSLKLGKANAAGFIIETFDESSQIAVISTPRGKFEVSMNTQTAFYTIHNTESESVSYAQTDDIHTSTIMRKKILENIR